MGCTLGMHPFSFLMHPSSQTAPFWLSECILCGSEMHPCSVGKGALWGCTLFRHKRLIGRILKAEPINWRMTGPACPVRSALY